MRFYMWHDRTSRMPSAYGLCFVGLGNKLWLCDIAPRPCPTSVSSSPSSSIGASLCSGTGQRSWAGHWTSMSCLHCNTQEGMHSNNSVQNTWFLLCTWGFWIRWVTIYSDFEKSRFMGKIAIFGLQFEWLQTQHRRQQIVLFCTLLRECKCSFPFVRSPSR